MPKDWMEKRAANLLQEALQADPENGTQKLVLALITRMKAEGRPCRGHGSCYVTGRCPYDPTCDN